MPLGPTTDIIPFVQNNNMTTVQAAKSLNAILSGFKTSIGEPPYSAWEDLSELRQRFLIDAIPFVCKLGNEVRNHEIRCQRVHNYWIEWSQINDPTHSSLIPYSELSATEKIKDGLVVNTILAMERYITDL